MPRFRTRPVTIEAEEISAENHAALHRLAAKARDTALVTCGGAGDQYTVTVSTAAGDLTGAAGDWLILDAERALSPCRADIFARTYEPMEG